MGGWPVTGWRCKIGVIWRDLPLVTDMRWRRRGDFNARAPLEKMPARERANRRDRLQTKFRLFRFCAAFAGERGGKRRAFSPMAGFSVRMGKPSLSSRNHARFLSLRTQIFPCCCSPAAAAPRNGTPARAPKNPRCCVNCVQPTCMPRSIRWTPDGSGKHRQIPSAFLRDAVGWLPPRL